MAVRSSIYHKPTEGHAHSFDAEQYDDDEDIYFQLCKICGYKKSYEKM